MGKSRGPKKAIPGQGGGEAREKRPSSFESIAHGDRELFLDAAAGEEVEPKILEGARHRLEALIKSYEEDPKAYPGTTPEQVDALRSLVAVDDVPLPVAAPEAAPPVESESELMNDVKEEKIELIEPSAFKAAMRIPKSIILGAMEEEVAEQPRAVDRPRVEETRDELMRLKEKLSEGDYPRLTTEMLAELDALIGKANDLLALPAQRRVVRRVGGVASRKMQKDVVFVDGIQPSENEDEKTSKDSAAERFAEEDEKEVRRRREAKKEIRGKVEEIANTFFGWNKETATRELENIRGKLNALHRKLVETRSYWGRGMNPERRRKIIDRYLAREIDDDQIEMRIVSEHLSDVMNDLRTIRDLDREFNELKKEIPTLPEPPKRTKE